MNSTMEATQQQGNSFVEGFLIVAVVFAFLYGPFMIYDVLVPKYDLVGLVGPKGTGKTLVEEYLRKVYGFSAFQFAGALKQMAEVEYKFTRDQLYTELKDVIDPRYGCTPRDKLHDISDGLTATDSGFLTRLAESWLSKERAYGRKPLISDNRTPHQINYTYNRNGILIYLVRFDNKDIKAEEKDERKEFTDLNDERKEFAELNDERKEFAELKDANEKKDERKEFAELKDMKESKEVESSKTHITEQYHTPTYYNRTHVIFNNGTKEELFLQIDSIMDYYGFQSVNRSISNRLTNSS